MNVDPAWQAYLAKATPFLFRMETQLVVNAPFFKP